MHTHTHKYTNKYLHADTIYINYNLNSTGLKEYTNYQVKKCNWVVL